MSTRPIEVWAPLADRVWLHVRNSRIPLDRNAAGWWTSERIIDEAILRDPMLDYGLAVDDGPPRPDPRSAWQPYGMQGPSRRVDHSVFPWQDRAFQARPLSSALIYELHVGTFSQSGTFTSAIAHLDHLVELGVTHVELMPVAETPGQYGWGYDGVCLFAPSSVYGGPHELKQFVDACHARGLAVILDVVYNHLGPVGNYLADFGPYFTNRHSTPWGPAINFDGPHSDQVRRFFCDNALMWLRDYHIDGLRLDAVHSIVDTTAYPFLEQLADEVAQLGAHLGRHLVLIAESDLNDPRLVRAVEAGGYGLNAQWCDDFHHALHTALTYEDRGYYADFGSLEMLGAAFQQPYLYAGQFAPARGRSHGRSAYPLSGHRFVTYSQNHDQIGNRARGERLGHLVGFKLAKVAAALVMTSPYVPQLFQGEEWFSESPFLYFADWRNEPELAEAVRHGRQEEFAAFGWRKDELFDPIAEETFQRCKLDWHKRSTDESAQMLNWYRRLISLRRSEPDLSSGVLESVVHVDEASRCLTVRRGRVLIVLNLDDHAHTIALTTGVQWQVMLSSSDDSRLDDDVCPTRVVMDGASVMILAQTDLNQSGQHMALQCAQSSGHRAQLDDAQHDLPASPASEQACQP